MTQQPAPPTERETDPPAAVAVTAATVPTDGGAPAPADLSEAGGNGVWVAFLLGVIALLAVCVLLILVAASRPFP